jgi:hypothetical protein
MTFLLSFLIGRTVPTSQILCVACSQYQEWDRENVILTGSSDGIVRVMLYLLRRDGFVETMLFLIQIRYASCKSIVVYNVRLQMWSLDYEEVPIDQVKASSNQDDKSSNDGIDSDDASSTAELAR